MSRLAVLLGLPLSLFLLLHLVIITALPVSDIGMEFSFGSEDDSEIRLRVPFDHIAHPELMKEKILMLCETKTGTRMFMQTGTCNVVGALDVMYRFVFDLVDANPLPITLPHDAVTFVRSRVGGAPPLEVRIGLGSYGHDYIEWFFWNEPNISPCTIGRFTQIAGNVSILVGGNHFYKRAAQYPFTTTTSTEGEVTRPVSYSKGPVRIGSDVWICYGVTVLSGVTVGDGAVLGAGAVVRDDVPQYAIVVGNPAQVVGYRFDDDTIAQVRSAYLTHLCRRMLLK